MRDRNIKGTKFYIIATSGVYIQEIEKVGKSENSKKIVHDDIEIEEFGKVGKQ